MTTCWRRSSFREGQEIRGDGPHQPGPVVADRLSEPPILRLPGGGNFPGAGSAARRKECPAQGGSFADSSASIQNRNDRSARSLSRMPTDVILVEEYRALRTWTSSPVRSFLTVRRMRREHAARHGHRPTDLWPPTTTVSIASSSAPIPMRRRSTATEAGGPTPSVRTAMSTSRCFLPHGAAMRVDRWQWHLLAVEIAGAVRGEHADLINLRRTRTPRSRPRSCAPHA